ncbi:hypothetical protein, partial, partial [Absidia glauca]
TEQDIQEAYATIVDWTAEIVQGIAPSLYREGKILWSHLHNETKTALANELANRASGMGIYLQHCMDNWAARRFLQIKINSKQRSIKKPKATTTGNVPLESLSMPDDSMSFTSIMRGAYGDVNEPLSYWVEVVVKRTMKLFYGLFRIVSLSSDKGSDDGLILIVPLSMFYFSEDVRDGAGTIGV